MPHMARHIPAPLVALGTDTCSLLILAGAWLGYIGGWDGTVSAAGLMLALCLALAVVMTFWWPIHLRPRTKIYMASVPYYLLAVLVPPPLAAVAAAAGALTGEVSVRRRRGTTRSSIATEAGRRALIVWLGAVVAQAPVGASWHVPALIAAAILMEAGDILSCPLVIAPLSGEPPLRIIRAVAREAYLLEGAQYLIGLLGALALTNQLWALALLAAPTALLYLAFRALSQAEQAQHTAEQARQLAEQAVRTRDDFLLAGSHDLRTPLTVVLGRIDLLKALLDSGKTPDPDMLGRQLLALQKAASRMFSTVEEMTDLVHLQLGQTLALHLEPVDLTALVQETIALVGSASSIGSAPVFMRGAADAVVEGDRARLGRMLQNIIGNAVKFTPDATPVRVDLATTDAWVTIAVSDRGVGIPAADLARVFEPFYRASTVAGIPGSGIGLAGARSIVEQHHGHITIESTAGLGTTVNIALPRGPMARGA